MTQGVGAHRFQALDGWRGLCALGVALFHLQANSHIAAFALVRNAWLLVDFFFVLSGFVIAYAYGGRLQSRAQAATFTLRRFARLWPLHVAILAALIALELYRYAATGTGFAGERSVFAIFTNLALVQSLGVHGTLTWNTPAWSISTEFYTYLVFAGACLLGRSAASRAAFCGLLVVMAVVVLTGFSRYGMRETFDWGFFRCLYGFFLGALAFEVWNRGWFAKVRGSAVEIAMLAIAIGYLVYVPGHHALEYLAPLLFAVLVLVFAQESGVVSRALTWRPINALGRWSYSIYMVHMLVIALLFSALDSSGLHWTRFLPRGTEAIVFANPFAADAATLCYLAAVIALAAFTWRAIELPGQQFARKTNAAAAPVALTR